MGPLNPTVRTVLARRPSGRRAAVYAAISGISFGWVLFAAQPLPASWKAALGAVLSVTFIGSDLLYRALRGPLGRVTAYAALCLAWAALWAVLAVSSNSCLSAGRTTGCSSSEVAQFSAVGLLFPLLLPAVTFLPWLTYRGATRLWQATGWKLPRPERTSRRAQAGASTKDPYASGGTTKAARRAR